MQTNVNDAFAKIVNGVEMFPAFRGEVFKEKNYMMVLPNVYCNTIIQLLIV